MNPDLTQYKISNLNDEHKYWLSQLYLEYQHDTQKATPDEAKFWLEMYPPSRIDFKSVNKMLFASLKLTDHRQSCVFSLVNEAYKRSTKPDFEFVVCADDNPRVNFQKRGYCFSTNVNYNDFDATVPDYSFWSLNLKGRYGYPGEGNDDYNSLTKDIIEAGKQPPLTDKIGWIGTTGVNSRKHLVDLGSQPPLNEFCEFIDLSWHGRENNLNSIWPNKFITLTDQIKRWRFLIDVQGGSGWTDRLKFFFFANRVIFCIEKYEHEFYFPKLKPWVHYVPVDPWKKNLKENYDKVMSEPELETELKRNAFEFAHTHLLQEHAIEYYRQLIDNTNWEAEKQKATFASPTTIEYPHWLSIVTK